VRSFLCIPLISGGQVLGTLNLVNSESETGSFQRLRATQSSRSRGWPQPRSITRSCTSRNSRRRRSPRA
jgi:hypothetical protein